jgi:AbrB family looped-hinge helix DNA binding protein
MPKSTELNATVSSKGQVVIPGDVRRRLGLVQGSILRFVRRRRRRAPLASRR